MWLRAFHLRLLQKLCTVLMTTPCVLPTMGSEDERQMKNPRRSPNEKNGKEQIQMNLRKGNWITVTAIAGTLLLGSAYLMLPNVAAQEEMEEPAWQGPGDRGPGFRGPEGRGRRPGGFMHWRMMRQLELTEEQQNMLQELRQAHRAATEVERGAIRDAAETFHKAVRALETGEGSEDEVYIASQALAELKAELAVKTAAQRAEVRNILTPEQQQKLEEFRAEMKVFREERMEQRKERFKKLREEGQNPGRSL
jgi:Spy/CpxP family protein refolding chaperone